jgi:hypothetical protein
MYGGATGVGEKLTQSYWFAGSYRVTGEFPAGEVGIHVCVEGKLAVLYQAEARHCSEGLTDGARLKHRFRIHRRSPDAAHAESTGPLDFAIVKDSDADAGHIEFLHAVGECMRRVLVAFQDDSTDEAGRDVLNVLLNFCLVLRRVLRD